MCEKWFSWSEGYIPEARSIRGRVSQLMALHSEKFNSIDTAIQADVPRPTILTGVLL
ncbi:hypothetical protein BSBH6_01599 [Bacillus subtilis]|nr:hypothetical protein BSBH6_01599 [Bacillus subtilis]RPK25678.1 hypothetical protein BH5_02510 [Bacillus subtilis]